MTNVVCEREHGRHKARERTGILNKSVVPAAPKKPSHVLLGLSLVKGALMIFRPRKTPQKYAEMSLQMIIDAGNTTLPHASQLRDT